MTLKKALLLLVGVVLYFNIGQLFLEWVNFAVTNPETISAHILNPFSIKIKEGMNDAWIALLGWPILASIVLAQWLFILAKTLLWLILGGGIAKFAVG